MDEKSKVDKWIFSLKNNKYSAPVILGAFILTAVLTFGKAISESFFKNKELEGTVQGLRKNMDTIAQSLQAYNLTIVNNKVSPIQSNIENSKNASGVNYGQVGDIYHQTKTYNQSSVIHQATEPIKVVSVENEKQSKVEIESPRSPLIRKGNESRSAIFTLKTKSKEEASNVSDYFSAVSRYKGVLQLCENYGSPNTTIVTNYPTEFSYDFNLLASEKNADTFYVFLRVSYKNDIGQSQVPFQVLYRKIVSQGEGLVRVYTGTKEYKDVVEFIFLNSAGVL